jgi:hypothetical protein
VVELRESMPLRLRRWIVVAALVVAAIVVVWAMQRGNTAVSNAQCSARYKVAHTAADTAEVDRVRPGMGGRDQADPLTCGHLRMQR